MSGTLARLVKIFVYATFFVPLVVVSSSFIFPFIVPKILLFRSLVVLMVAGFNLLLISNWQDYKVRFSPGVMALSVFFLSFAISTIVGVDAYHSFWDNHERMLGLFTIVHYFLYFLVVTTVFKTWSEWKWALRIFLLAGSLVMLIAVLQVANPQLLLNQGSVRVGSSLGNPIYVGGYGLFLFFVALLLALKESDRVWQAVYGVSAILAFVGMFYSGTKGSLLGWIVGIIVMLIGYLIGLKGRSVARYAIGGILIVGFLALGILYLNRQAPPVKNIPLLGSLLNLSLTKGTASTRLIAWEIAVDSWRERPIFGWGPNNFFYAFNKYYNPRSLEFGYGETWFDNAHNILLNTLTVQGIFGLLSYLAIFIITIYVLWSSKVLRDKQIHVVVVGSAFLLAHLVQNVTVFENPTSYLYFMFWLAMVNSLSKILKDNVASDQSLSVSPSRRVGIAPIGIAGIVAALFIFVFNIQPARANQKTLRTLAFFNQDPAAGLKIMNEALSFSSPHIDDIRADIGRMVVEVMAGRYANLDKTLANNILDTTRGVLEKNITLHPLDIRTYMTLAQLSQLSFAVNNDPRFINDANNFLEMGIQYSPRRQQLIYMLASIKAQLRRTDEAIKLMEQAISDHQGIPEGYWRLAVIYYYSGDIGKAKEVINLATGRGVVFDGQGKQVVEQIMGGPTPASKAK